MHIECLIYVLNWWRVRKVLRTIQIKFIVLAVSHKFRCNYGSSSKICLSFIIFKMIWKRTKVIKKNIFKINYVLLFWNRQVSVTIKIFIASLQNLYPSNSAWQWLTRYCFRNHHVHAISEESFRDHLRRSWWWILVTRKRGSGFSRQVYCIQRIMMRCSSLCFSE